MKNIVEFWDKLVDMIEEEGKAISPLGFYTWVKTIKPYDIINDTLILSVPLDVNKEMIEKRYLTLIKSAAVILNQNIKEIKVELEDNLYLYEKEDKDIVLNIDNEFYKNSNIISKFTFDNFVIGENNRFACAASQAVSKEPGKSYNPLYLYGDVGLGKTHLMHAVGNEILKNNNSSKILYISSEQFLNEMVDSIKNNNVNEFRDKYRTLDVLMIDDIQFISGKERCQEEFFHTFNHLSQSNKQIIIASDRPPRDISTLDERLRSRFEGGLNVDIKKPDYETRIAILKMKIQNDNIHIDDEIVEIIAKKVKSNIRELEGVLNKIVAFSSLTGKTVTKETISDFVSDIEEVKSNKILNIDTIIYEISKYYDIDPKIIKSESRKKEIMIIRQIAMYIIREVTDISLPKIGESFGGKNHATVLHSIEKVEKLMSENDEFKNEVNDILSTIKNMF